MYCEGEEQRKLVHRIKRIRGQVNVIERSLSTGETDDAVLMLLTTVRGGINSLLAEILTGRIHHCLSAGPEDLPSALELKKSLVDLVRAYLK